MYTQVTSRCYIRDEQGYQDKAQYVDNGYSIFKYCNAVLLFLLASRRANRKQVSSAL